MRMPPLRRAFQVWCCLPFFLSQSLCRAIQWPSDSVRAQSLNLLPAVATNQLLTAATRNSALLFYGMEVTTHHSESNTITLAVNGPPDSCLGAGVAVAIDARGYFLTAAHVVAEPPPFTLVFRDGSALRSAPARIVAQISRRSKWSPGLDLALLHVEHVQLANVFAWAEIDPTPRPNSVVLQLGEVAEKLTETNVVFQLSPVAGHFKKIVMLRSGGAVIRSDVPGRPGDSGGPLLDSHGELLAITAGLHFPVLGSPLAYATRPNLNWLRDTIEKDQRSKPVTETAVKYAGEPTYVTVRLAE
jgi:S1-C subfamily serine protease